METPRGIPSTRRYWAGQVLPEVEAMKAMARSNKKEEQNISGLIDTFCGWETPGRPQ